MTNRDVDAAVALIRGLRFYQDAGPDIPNCVPMRPLLTVQAINGLTLGHLRLLCAALAEARQKLAAQAQETTRERTWCRAVAAQLENAERQLAKQAREITRLKKDGEQADRVAQAAIRDAVTETFAAQRKRDAQQLDNAAAELNGTSRVNSNIARILREEAAKMRGAGRAARTPEPTGTEDQ